MYITTWCQFVSTNKVTPLRLVPVYHTITQGHPQVNTFRLTLTY